MAYFIYFSNTHDIQLFFDYFFIVLCPESPPIPGLRRNEVFLQSRGDVCIVYTCVVSSSSMRVTVHMQPIAG